MPSALFKLRFFNIKLMIMQLGAKNTTNPNWEECFIPHILLERRRCTVQMPSTRFAHMHMKVAMHSQRFGQNELLRHHYKFGLHKNYKNWGCLQRLYISIFQFFCFLRHMSVYSTVVLLIAYNCICKFSCWSQSLAKCII